MPKNLKQLNKGGYGSGQLDADDLAFLKPSEATNAWEASSSNFDPRWSDRDDATAIPSASMIQVSEKPVRLEMKA